MSGVDGAIFSECFDSDTDHGGLRRLKCMETWDMECENRTEGVPRVSTAALAPLSESGL